MQSDKDLAFQLGFRVVQQSHSDASPTGAGRALYPYLITKPPKTKRYPRQQSPGNGIPASPVNAIIRYNHPANADCPKCELPVRLIEPEPAMPILHGGRHPVRMGSRMNGRQD